MIRTILVALDPATDTHVAVQYAADVARRHEATVTGLAVIDMKHIAAEAHGGGIGSMYQAEKLRANLTAEAQATAHTLLETFEKASQAAGVRHRERVAEGVPFQRIIEDMKYRDLLIMGRDPHFFYSHPTQKTRTLARVIRDTIAPTLIVGDAYRPVRRVLVAYSGSKASARALRRFVHLQPFGEEVVVQVLHVYRKDAAESVLLLDMARWFLETHDFTAETISRQGADPNAVILEAANAHEADLIVAGAHLHTQLRQLVLRDSTTALFEASPVPLLVDH